MSKFSETNWEEIKAMYEGGLTTSQLRQKTGIDKKTILRGLHSVGTQMRRPGIQVGRKLGARPYMQTDRLRECSVCGDTKHRIVRADPDLCRSCWSKERRLTDAGKDSYLRKKYGISLEQAQAMLAGQNGMCPICGEEIALFEKMWLGGAAVDHDHTSGVVRGLLCHACNIAIGLLRDNNKRLDRAQSYLNIHVSGAKIHKSATMFHPITLLNPGVIEVCANSRVDSFVKIEGGLGVVLGELTHCASFCHLNIGGGELVMHHGSSLGSGVRVITGSNVHGYNISCSAIHPTAQFKRGKLVIERNAVVFAGATITPGCTSIGVNAVIAAGAVVTKPVPAYEIWAGVPARRIGDVRDGADVVAEVTTPEQGSPGWFKDAVVKSVTNKYAIVTLPDWVERMDDWEGHDK